VLGIHHYRSRFRGVILVLVRQRRAQISEETVVRRWKLGNVDSSLTKIHDFHTYIVTTIIHIFQFTHKVSNSTKLPMNPKLLITDTETKLPTVAFINHKIKNPKHSMTHSKTASSSSSSYTLNHPSRHYSLAAKAGNLAAINVGVVGLLLSDVVLTLLPPIFGVDGESS
jgi:hypothetical protein